MLNLLLSYIILRVIHYQPSIVHNDIGNNIVLLIIYVPNSDINS